eukprot:495444-Prymnesium_polylepis.1
MLACMRRTRPPLCLSPVLFSCQDALQLVGREALGGGCRAARWASSGAAAGGSILVASPNHVSQERGRWVAKVAGPLTLIFVGPSGGTHPEPIGDVPKSFTASAKQRALITPSPVSSPQQRLLPP